MSIKSILMNSIKKGSKHEEGFSLIETVIALVTLGICLAYAMPLFLFAKINNSKSEIRTGALIVAQRTFDNIRAKSFSNMPLTDGQAWDTGDANLTNAGTTWKIAANTGTATNPLNPEVIPANITVPTGSGKTITDQEKLLTFAMGRQYRTKVKYCSGISTDATVCSDKYRAFIIEVYHNGTKVYDLQGTYTKFE
jgi:type II secretory pathway pseudopilin PulG